MPGTGCLKLLDAMQDVAAVQRLIAINEKQKAELLAIAKEQPELAAHIEGAIEFRAKVLASFNKLVGSRG